MNSNKIVNNGSVEFVEIEGMNYFRLLIPGNKDIYVETLRSLVGLLSAIDRNDIREGDVSLVCNLLESMLPSFTQIK